MSRVRGKNTTPEIRTRRCAHAMGLRFRLHRKDLPGNPDIVFPRHRLVIFVHGCFWHRHPHCPKASIPKSRTEYWEAKFAVNVARDARVSRALVSKGWRVGVIWECETRDKATLSDRLRHLVDVCDDGLKEDLSPWVEKLVEAFCPKADEWGNQ